MRINARIEEEQAKQLESIKRTEHLTTTQVVKRALDLYFEQKKLKHKSGIQQLLESDFIGCAEGPEDLSDDYKKYLTQSLGQKHDLAKT